MNPGDKPTHPKSPKWRRNEKNVGIANEDNGQEVTFSIKDAETKDEKQESVEESQIRAETKPSTTGAFKSVTVFPRKKSSSNTDDEQIIPLDKINEEYVEHDPT